MTRIQKYIVGLRMHDKQLREEDARKDDPFGKKEEKKVTIPKHLRYSGDEDLFKAKMQTIAKHWCEDEKEAEHTRKV